MTKGEKNQVIDHLVGKLTTNSHFYLADLSQMTVEQSSALRGVFHQKGIRLEVVKNSLLQKALERIEGKDYSQVISTLSGNTCILFTETGNLPAKVIKDFRKKYNLQSSKISNVMNGERNHHKNWTFKKNE